MAQEAGEEDVRFRRRSFGDLESFVDFNPSQPYVVPFHDERLAHTGVHPRYFPEMRQDLRRWGETKSRGAPPELVADANFPDEDDEEEEIFSPPTTSVANFPRVKVTSSVPVQVTIPTSSVVASLVPSTPLRPSTLDISMPTMVTPQDHHRSLMKTDQTFVSQPILPPLERPPQIPDSVDTEEDMDVPIEDVIVSLRPPLQP